MSTSSDSSTHNEPGTVPPLSQLQSRHSSPSSFPGYGSAQHKGDANAEPPVSLAGERVSVSEVMTWLHSSQQSPTSWQSSTWLLALVALGIHGLLLLIPIPSEHKPTPPKPEKQVRVTQLTLQPKLPAVKARPQASPSPQKLPSLPPPITRPRSVTLPETKPKVRETPPEPKSKPRETPPESKQKAQETPSQPKAQQTPQVNPTPAPSNSDTNPWENFPKYPSAKPGCFQKDFCIQTGAKLDEVAAYFEKELPAKQYQWKATIQESSRKVYQVSAQNGKSQFLSLIFTGREEGTVYVLGENALSLGDFKKAVQVPPEIADILTATGLESQNIDASYFSESDKFYSSGVRRPEISSITLVPDQPSSTLMDTFLKTNLQNNNYEVSEPKIPYGGGIVYEVKKDKLGLYFNLIPTKDGSGTIVVIWGSPPG